MIISMISTPFNEATLLQGTYLLHLEACFINENVTRKETNQASKPQSTVYLIWKQNNETGVFMPKYSSPSVNWQAIIYLHHTDRANTIFISRWVVAYIVYIN